MSTVTGLLKRLILTVALKCGDIQDFPNYPEPSHTKKHLNPKPTDVLGP